MKEYFKKFGGSLPEDLGQSEDIEEMEEQFVVLSKSELIVDTASSLIPTNFQDKDSLVPLVHMPAAPKRTQTPMQFSSLTVRINS
jgi:hypothetical protein